MAHGVDHETDADAIGLAGKFCRIAGQVHVLPGVAHVGVISWLLAAGTDPTDERRDEQ